MSKYTVDVSMLPLKDRDPFSNSDPQPTFVIRHSGEIIGYFFHAARVKKNMGWFVLSDVSKRLWLVDDPDESEWLFKQSTNPLDPKLRTIHVESMLEFAQDAFDRGYLPTADHAQRA
jgi:hypothetical protein